MESLEAAACSVDDLLDFSSDTGEEDDEDENNKKAPLDSIPRNKIHHQEDKAVLNIYNSDKDHRSLPVLLEEELEWLSNKDAFPTIETLDIILEKPSNGLVLENSSSGSGSVMNCCSPRVPVRARSKRRRRRRSSFSFLSGHPWCEPKKKSRGGGGGGATIRMTGRACVHCQTEKTPQWRAGPLGPKTLCNACGVRYKSGRLMPEYRPASSPSFSSKLHSNSHRKILEIRREKQEMLQSFQK